MQTTNKGKTVVLNETERAPLENAKELLESLACIPFEGQEASRKAVVEIRRVLTDTAKPVPANADSEKDNT